VTAARARRHLPDAEPDRSAEETAAVRRARLKQAEKYARQGRLDPAIAEVRRWLEVRADDWPVVELLGNMLMRAGRNAEAADEFRRLLDHLMSTASGPAIALLCKKMLRVAPRDERAALLLADIHFCDREVAAGKARLQAVAEWRTARGDTAGAAELQLRVAECDPEDLEVASAAAAASLVLGDRQGAARRFAAVADACRTAGRVAEAMAAQARACELLPLDEDLLEQLAVLALETGDLARASESARRPETLRAVAEAFVAAGRPGDAADVLRRLLAVNPGDAASRLQLVDLLTVAGDAEQARQVVRDGPDTPSLLMRLVQLDLAAGDGEAAHAAAARLLAADLGMLPEVATLCVRHAAATPDAAFQCLEAALTILAAQEDWGAVSTLLWDHVSQSPHHLPALMRLVEACVDGGLETGLRQAQGQLADACLAAGQAREARVIVEDLAVIEPWNRAHFARWRSALTMLGENDPDSVIADRLCADSPLVSLDTLFEQAEPETQADDPSAAAGDSGVGVAAASAAPHVGESAETEQAPLVAGDEEPEVVKALKARARTPRHRYEASVALAHYYRESGDEQEAVEWFERAADLAPTQDAANEILYDLAKLLQSLGESDRALAVLLALQVHAPDYRDVAMWVRRASKAARRE
jgi:tetratricopeptide (TPR) repeat protein